MASAADEELAKGLYTTHEQRTNDIVRAKSLQTARITEIKQATKSVRLIKFSLEPPNQFKFKAGQWVDCFTPASEQAGGFTVVSTPAEGLEGSFQLAVQQADRNPPAKWLWRPTAELVDKQTVDVRVGGQFSFPPVNFRRLSGKIQSIVIICGGIGVNPMISILGALRDSRAPLAVKMLYGIRKPEDALFLSELDVLTKSSPKGIGLDLEVFVSGTKELDGVPGVVKTGRLTERDLDRTIDQAEKDSKLYYICGPAKMTDWAQEYLLAQGVDKDTVQTERWW